MKIRSDILVDKNKLILKMKERMDSLEELINKDVGGGLHTALSQWREIKYWKEAIERGEFDIRKEIKK